MLLTLQDDGILRPYQSPEEAVRDVEGLDAEQTFREIFDETGQTYTLEWIRPNSGRWIVQSGSYRFAATGVYAIDRLLQIIVETQTVEPEGSDVEVQEIRRRLAPLVTRFITRQ